jgi:hypothetical protein
LAVRILARLAHYIGVRRGFWFFILAATALAGSDDSEAAAKATTPIAASDPLILQVQVVEGEGLSYPPGSRSVKGITVRVTNEVGRPVAGAAVSFRLPEDGATGTFQNKSKTEIAATSADGRASVWGMQWGKTVGTLTIRITAAKGATRAGTTATQVISLDANGQTISDNRKAYKSHGGGGMSKKWIWIAAGGAGAAGGGLLAYEMLKSKSPSTNTVTNGVLINPPQVTVGPPN